MVSFILLLLHKFKGEKWKRRKFVALGRTKSKTSLNSRRKYYYHDGCSGLKTGGGKGYAIFYIAWGQAKFSQHKIFCLSSQWGERQANSEVQVKIIQGRAL